MVSPQYRHFFAADLIDSAQNGQAISSILIYSIYRSNLITQDAVDTSCIGKIKHRAIAVDPYAASETFGSEEAAVAEAIPCRCDSVGLADRAWRSADKACGATGMMFCAFRFVSWG